MEFRIKQEDEEEDYYGSYTLDPIPVEALPISTKAEVLTSKKFSQTSQYKVNCYKKNLKSIAWSYYGLLTDMSSVIIDNQKEFYFCRVCVEEQGVMTKYKRSHMSTIGMLTHLMNDHSISCNEELKQLGVEQNTCNFCHGCFENKLALEQHIKDYHLNLPPISTQIKKESDEMSKNAIVSSNTETPESKLQFKVQLYRNPSKSFAWKYFGLIVDANNVIIQDCIDFHFCRLCVEKCNVPIVKYKKPTATSVMIQHLKTEHSVEPTNCDSPGKIVTMVAKKSSRKNRIRIKKIPYKGPKHRYLCDICGKSYDRKDKIRLHMRLKHLNEILPADFTCDICGKSFTKNYILLKHMTMHSGIKFPCDRCPIQLCSQNSLRRHQKLHLNAKRFICKICGAAYSVGHALTIHMRKHNGTYEKRFTCEVCGLKKFHLGGLKIHIRIHTGEKPHQCEHCERRYALKADLTRHLRLHLGQNTYKCEFCSEAFRLLAELRDHYQVHYQIKPDIGNTSTSLEL